MADVLVSDSNSTSQSPGCPTEFIFPIVCGLSSSCSYGSTSSALALRDGRGGPGGADGDANHFRDATDAEVSLLLRCWLSPLEPLPLERYSDLGAPA